MLRRFPKPTHLNLFGWRGFFLFSLLLTILLTLLAIVQVQHEIRHTETAYYLALKKNIEAKEEWGRLMLEKTHLSSPARIEKIAQSKLNMVFEKSQKKHNLQIIYLQEKPDEL